MPASGLFSPRKPPGILGIKPEPKRSDRLPMSHLGKILVVDDEPRWLEPLSHVLTSAGYDVRAVNGGEPALASVAGGLPDLILLDIRMPGMGGFEVLRRFKALEETRDIPVLMISAFAEVDERIEGLKLGAVDSITKPFHAGELLARVRMQLELSRLRSQHEVQTSALQSANEKLQSEIARKELTEQELRKSEERLRFALHTMSAGAWELDLVDHTAHRTLLHDRIFGYETKLPAWTYEMFLEHVLPEDRAEVDRCFRAATETHSDWGFECRIRRTDGAVRWIWAAGAHERNSEGNPVRMAGIVQDITERQMAEAALRENQANLAITLLSIGDGVIATDAGGRITRMNPVAERLTGWPFAEAEGRPMAEVFRIVNARTGQPMDNPVEQVIACGLTVGLANHTLLLARDGKEYQIADSAAPIRDPYGEILGVVLVFSDVTGSYEAREELRRSEENYRMLFEAMLEGFALHEIICDDSARPADYRFLAINPAFEKMTGIRAADAVGKTVRELMPEVEPVWIERYGRVALTGEPAQFEGHSADLGKDFHVTAYRPQPGRFAVVFQDVTASKAAEARILRLTQLYAALSQCNQAIVHSGSLEELLPQVCCRVVEFGGMKMAWIGMVDEATGMVRQAASYGSGTDFLQGVQITTDAREFSGRGPTGTAIRENRPVWCQDYANDPSTAPWHEHGACYGWRAAAALPLRRGGKTVGALVVYSDKTHVFDEEVRGLLEEMADDISFALDSFAAEVERRGAEQALIESERDLVRAQEIAHLGSWSWDIVTDRVSWSDEMFRIYGVDPAAFDAREEDVARLIHPEDLWKQERAIRESFAGLPGQPFDYRVIRPDGTERVVEVSSVQLDADPEGRPLRMFGVAQDITERKIASEELNALNSYLEEQKARAEQLAVEAQAAARAKSEFLALMSHELRTPLNGVLGFAELLSGTRLDEEQQEFTRTILDSGTHLLDLVNDILDFSSIEKGRIQIESALISVASLVESSCRPMRKAAADKGLEFSCVVAADVPQEITGDIRRIRQILINLLGNAIKFTRQGSVVLEIAPSSLDGRQALDFSVEDTGPGIPSKVIGHLFEPFTQADSTVSRQFEGTGLGLAISLRLAEAMGGTLGVVSTPGKGSRFTFRFPLGAGIPSAASNGGGTGSSGPDKPGVAAPLPLSGNPVLVVEDDSSSRILVGKMLELLGCRAEFVTNGQEAVEAFAPERYAAILMDMQMPVMGGLDATRKIRESESGTRVPIIALTANVMQGDRELCLAAGMDEVLTKPFKMAELSAMLARFLKG